MFTLEMLKPFNKQDYEILLSTPALPFLTLQNYLIPAISLSKPDLILDNDMITKFNMTEESIMISNPEIIINLMPFLDIRIKGKQISSCKEETLILGVFANLDGEMVSNLKLI